MNKNSNTLRLWWQKPKRTSDLSDDRRVTFLELFYDLVYVVIIAELTHTLAKDVSLIGVATFVFLFFIVWWAWLNGTLYHDLHGNNDIRTRVFTFLQMIAVVLMAIFAGDALGEGYQGFALSFAFFQLILLYLWWRTGVHDPLHRPLSTPYSWAFVITTGLFVFSAFIEPPFAFYLWALALVVSLVLPFSMLKVARKDKEVEAEFERSMHIRPSLVERFGLFTIIVLGEVIVGVVQGVAGHHYFNFSILTIAILGTLVAIGMWWIYFDFISHRDPIQRTSKIFPWYYLHLPVTISIAMVGAGVLNVIEHAEKTLPEEVRWLLVISVAVFLVSITLLIKTIQIKKINLKIHTTGGRIMFISALLLLFLGFSNFNIIPMFIFINLLVLAPVRAAFKVWVRKAQNIHIPM